MKTLIATAIAAAFALPAPASSADGDKKAARTEGAAGTSGGLMSRLDRNNDGSISRDEAKDATELQGRFAELDQNNDGKISREELNALESERSARSAAGSSTPAAKSRQR